ncbi:hypothetical protein BGZ49_003491, partial [Haplosporangium sp. Z 27]
MSSELAFIVTEEKRNLALKAMATEYSELVGKMLSNLAKAPDSMPDVDSNEYERLR